MADCAACGTVPGEIGYKCNRCGREFCWDHRRPADHGCQPDRNGAGIAPPSTDHPGDQVSQGRPYPWWVYVLLAVLVVGPSVVGGIVALVP